MTNQNRYLRAIKAGALALGALTPLFISQRLWPGIAQVEFIPIALWNMSPFVVLFIVTALLERYSAMPKIFHVNCIISVIVLAFSIWAYSIAFEETDTSGLIFLFGPVWVYVVGFSSLALSLLLIRLTMKPTR